MRNGFNTAGFSEMVHEIRTDPREANFLYQARARRSSASGVIVTLLPALIGTVKSSREFSAVLETDPGGPAWDGSFLPSAMEMALTGVGACMLTTLVGGGSANRAEFDSAALAVDVLDRAEAGGFVGASFTMAGPEPREYYAALVDKVRRYSPNFVSLVEALPVTLVTPHGTSSLALTGGAQPPRALETSGDCDLRWVSGPQIESYPRRAAGISEFAAPQLRVDAPKQLTGVDWGPNPQEYLLIGLAADLTNRLYELGRQRGSGARQDWTVQARAVEDVRGFLNAGEDTFVGLQDVELEIGGASAREIGETEFWELVNAAAGTSAVLRLLTDEEQIHLDWELSAD